MTTRPYPRFPPEKVMRMELAFSENKFLTQRVLLVLTRELELTERQIKVRELN
jgi:hypothetical protein